MSELPKEGPGAELKTAREGMDVSTREVADALNLPVHVIEALEADDFERLPPTVFTRGYLRSYARLLELSPESLLARYPEVTEEVDAITGELPVAELPSGYPARTLGIAAAVGLVLIVLLVFLLGDEESSSDPKMPVTADREAELERKVETTETTETTETAETISEPEIAQPLEAEQAATGSEASAVPAPSEAVEEDSTPSLPAAAVREDPPAEVAEAPSAEVSPSFRERRITEFGDDEITMVFSEDCWVEVKSADGENLYSDLNRTGRTLVLTGRAPFRVLLGYAPGVTLSFNGEPVPLARYSRNNVANLVLGE